MGRKILIAVAWPYVNGSLHLGHVAALLPADVLVRYHRLKGDDVLCVSGSDCHGTPIQVTAEQEKVPPRQVAERYHAEFVAMMVRKLGISYSLYSATMFATHQQVAADVFKAVYESDAMIKRTQPHLFCEHCQRFLPDRYVEGGCPHCSNLGARGDQCDQCGRVIDALELKDPLCRICHNSPITKESTHLYLNLPAFADRLQDWFRRTARLWRANAIGMTEAWLKDGLRERAVTRDTDWGIPVPILGFTDKCIYVWCEAVTGYLSCSKEWAAGTANPEQWRDWWENNEAWHYYVHGKDNIPFHTVIWPAMLMALGLHLPDQIVSSEYLQLQGLQFSKSRHWAIWLPHALATFPVDAVRVYLLENNPETRDTSFGWEDFAQRVNGGLIGNLGNFWHRTFSLIHKHFGKVPRVFDIGDDGRMLIAQTKAKFETIAQAIERASFREAVAELLSLSTAANQYIHQREPWNRIKTDRSHAAITLYVCAQVANSLRVLAQPFVPFGCEMLRQFVHIQTADVWSFTELPSDTLVVEPIPVFTKIDPDLVAKELEKLKELETPRL